MGLDWTTNVKGRQFIALQHPNIFLCVKFRKISEPYDKREEESKI
jgi:hypothetical protein